MNKGGEGGRLFESTDDLVNGASPNGDGQLLSIRDEGGAAAGDLFALSGNNFHTVFDDDAVTIWLKRHLDIAAVVDGLKNFALGANCFGGSSDAGWSRIHLGGIFVTTEWFAKREDATDGIEGFAGETGRKTKNGDEDEDGDNAADDKICLVHDLFLLFVRRDFMCSWKSSTLEMIRGIAFKEKLLALIF